MSRKTFSIARACIFATIALYCLADLAAFIQSYGQFRLSGIAPSDLFDIQKSPLQASILYAYLINAAICVLLLYLFLEKSSNFPWTLLLYYIIAIGMPVVVFLVVRHNYSTSGEAERALYSARGTVIRNTVFLLPWVLYSFLSKSAKETFVN
nr:putative integron gene cassette protein [uncultured bacterium]